MCRWLAYTGSPVVLTEVLYTPVHSLIDSSGGQFATDTMLADSAALASGSASNDSAYLSEQARLRHLADNRDKLAGEIKAVLTHAAEGHSPSHGTVTSEIARANALLKQAHQLAGGH